MIKKKPLFYGRTYSIELALCSVINISLEDGMDQLWKNFVMGQCQNCQVMFRDQEDSQRERKL